MSSRKAVNSLLGEGPPENSTFFVVAATALGRIQPDDAAARFSP